MRLISYLLIIGLSLHTFAQEKTLSPDTYDTWKKIENFRLSSTGQLSAHVLKPGFGDRTLVVNNQASENAWSYVRGSKPVISWDESYVIFKISPAQDSVRALKRLKTKKDKMPQDSLGVFNVSEQSLTKIAPIKDFLVPKEWTGVIAYRLDEIREQPSKSDTTKKEAPKGKKVSKDNGYHLVIHDLATHQKDTFKYVTHYSFAKTSPYLLFESMGVDSTFEAGMYRYSVKDGQLKQLMSGEHTYEKPAMAEDGRQVAFLVDTDTTKALVRDYHLMYWKEGLDSALSKMNAAKLTDDWVVSKHGELSFSQDGSKLYFGTSPQPLVQDTALLDDEIIQVEIWNYQDARLMTQQEHNKKQDLERSYLAVYHTERDAFVQLEDEIVSNTRFANSAQKNKNIALVYDNMSYYKQVSWQGFPPGQDLYTIDLLSGEKTPVAQNTRAYAYLSLAGKYVVWYDKVDSAWYSYSVATKHIKDISKDIPTSVYDERDDHPDYPNPYGFAGWTRDDQYLLVYDRYDIWKVDPTAKEAPVNLTSGRASKVKYRVRILDRDNPEIDLKKAVLHTFNEVSKDEGYARLNGGKPKALISGAYAFDDLKKAKEGDKVVFTKSSHRTFPDYYATDLSFKKQVKISDANPQQADYRWSTVELVKWESLQGVELEGLLYKPEGFDATKKYPMIVYFYERNSDNLHSYRGGFPHRSIINPAYYASRGYVIFIPDIVYTDGYPGQSCYDAVMPGITKLLDQGFIDRERIGVQGHSWGGYQTAYLVTKTDLFACAESGAPVSNMVSAYGGIRWGSGLSRMFQYEHTQSRIGGTLWEYPMRYIENSPIFYADKISTPLLLMHNDEDGAVPWYQGIEFFVALRRLGQPAWMLNYNNEPHWPTKRENIKDFQVRMQQFFDHYLMGQPMPQWMSEGIPAIEKGINRGYEWDRK